MKYRSIRRKTYAAAAAASTPAAAAAAASKRIFFAREKWRGKKRKDQKMASNFWPFFFFEPCLVLFQFFSFSSSFSATGLSLSDLFCSKTFLHNCLLLLLSLSQMVFKLSHEEERGKWEREREREKERETRKNCFATKFSAMASKKNLMQSVVFCFLFRAENFEICFATASP